MAEACVLDTHAWLMAVAAPDRLPRRARRIMDRAHSLLVPAICTWEVALLANRGRLTLNAPIKEWIPQALAEDRIELAPLEWRIAMDAADLRDQGFHGDPVDGLVYATARHAHAPLITVDALITAFDSRVNTRQRTLVVWD